MSRGLSRTVSRDGVDWTGRLSAGCDGAAARMDLPHRASPAAMPDLRSDSGWWAVTEPAQEPVPPPHNAPVATSVRHGPLILSDIFGMGPPRSPLCESSERANGIADREWVPSTSAASPPEQEDGGCSADPWEACCPFCGNAPIEPGEAAPDEAQRKPVGGIAEKGRYKVRKKPRTENRLAQWYAKYGYAGVDYCKACSESFRSHLFRSHQSMNGCRRGAECDHCQKLLAQFSCTTAELYLSVDRARTVKASKATCTAKTAKRGANRRQRGGRGRGAKKIKKG